MNQSQPNRPRHSDKGQRPHGKIPSSPPTGGNFSSPIIHPQNPSFPGRIFCFPHLARKTSLPPDKLQFSHIGLQSKLQRQIAEGGIGSRKGKGPTKWEGPPAAICRCNINISHPCNIRKTNHSPDKSSISPTLSAKQAFPRASFSILTSICRASCSGR